MIPLIIGGVTLAAVGYSLKKYIDDEVIAQEEASSKIHDNTCSNKLNNFRLLYETKISFFNETIVAYEKKLQKITNLPKDIKINNKTIAFLKEEYDKELCLYDVANILALELNQQILTAKTFLDRYIPKMSALISDIRPLEHIFIDESMALLQSIKVINMITEISTVNILNQDNQVDHVFIKKLNNLKGEILKMEKQMQMMDDSYYMELTNIVLNSANEKPIGFGRVSQALSMGTGHKQITFTLKSKYALMTAAMQVVKAIKEIDDVKALIVCFKIPHEMPLDRVDEAIERIIANLGEEILIEAGTLCDYNCDEETIGVDAVAVCSCSNLVHRRY